MRQGAIPSGTHLHAAIEALGGAGVEAILAQPQNKGAQRLLGRVAARQLHNIAICRFQQ